MPHTQIADLLAEYPTGIPYLRFVVNPDSFAQTVENVFYLSFLVRENKVAIETELEEDSPYYQDVVVCESTRHLRKVRRAGRSADDTPRCAYVDVVDVPSEDDVAKRMTTQLVFEVTQKLWKVCPLSRLSSVLDPLGLGADPTALNVQDAIEAYDITESLIPHREGFKQTKEGEQRAAKW